MKVNKNIIMNRRQLYVTNLSYQTRWHELKDHFNNVAKVEFANVFLDDIGRSRGNGIVLFETEEGAAEALERLNESELDGRQIYVKYDAKPETRSKPLQQTRYVSTMPSAFDGGYGSSPSSYRPAYETSSYQSYPESNRIRRGGRGGGRGGRFEGQERFGGQGRFGGGVGMMRTERIIREYRSSRPHTGRQVFVRNLPFSVTWKDLKETFKEAGTVERADVFTRNTDGLSIGIGTVLFDQEAEAEKAVELFNESKMLGREIFVEIDNKVKY